VNWPGVWDELGIEPTKDQRAIKKAYAERLKKTRPEEHPEKFQALRRAYEAAVRGGTPRAAARPVDAPSLDGTLRQPRSQSALIDSAPLAEAATSIDIAPLIAECRGLSPEGTRQRLDAFVHCTDGGSLDAGWRLESALLHCFTQADFDDQALICAAIDKFGWEKPDHPFRREYAYRLGPLIGKARARAEVQGLLANDRSRRWSPQSHVLNALRRPPQLLWFHVLAASPGHFRMAEALLERWHARLPAMFEFELNLESVRWWEIRVWEGGLTLPKVFIILGMSAFLCIFPITGLLIILNSGEPWALWIAIPGGVSIAVSSVMGLRWLVYTMRRRLRSGPWRGKYARWRRLQQDVGLIYWLRAASALVVLLSPFLKAPSLQGGVGCVLFTLLGLQMGLQNAFFAALLAAPTAMALSAWAVFHGFGWRDRVLMMWIAGIGVCVAAFTAANRVLERRGWQRPFSSIFLCGLALLLLYVPLLIWKDLRVPD
jgi:hypothetical protein